MAKTRRRRTTKSIDAKIEAVKQRMEKARVRYEKLAASLKELMDRRDEIRTREISDAIRSSRHTYDEILNFIRA